MRQLAVVILIGSVVCPASTDQDSCIGRCADGFNETQKCQCESLCKFYKSCCLDYDSVCKQGLGEVFTVHEDEYEDDDEEMDYDVTGSPAGSSLPSAPSQVTTEPATATELATTRGSDTAEELTTEPEPVTQVATTSEPVTPLTMTPEPVTPPVTTPEPVTPPVTTPEPVTSPVTTPEPVTPLATTPEPVTPLETTPEPVTPPATTPEPVTPLATTPEPVTPPATTPEPVTPPVTTPEPVTPLETTPEPVTPLETTPEPVTHPATTPEPVTPPATTPEPVTPLETTPEPVTHPATTPEPVTLPATTSGPVTPLATTPETVTPLETTPEPVTHPATTPEPEPVTQVAMTPEPVPVTEVTVELEAKPKPKPSDHCSSSESFNAFTELKNESIVAFRGEYFYELDSFSVLTGYPKLISDVWGIPGPIDTAFTRVNCEGKTFIFKGDSYWRFDDGKLDGGYPQKIKGGFPGVPPNLDASFALPASSFHDKERVYFFKGNQYWIYVFDQQPSRWDCLQTSESLPFQRYAGRTHNLLERLFDALFQGFASGGYTEPHSISRDWSGLPSRLDAALPGKLLTVRRNVSVRWKGKKKRKKKKKKGKKHKKHHSSSNEHRFHSHSNFVAKQSIYFFARDKYYRVDLETKRVEDVVPPYPRSIARYWFKCRMKE